MQVTVDEHIPGSIKLDVKTGRVAATKTSVETTQSIQTKGGLGAIHFDDFSINNPLRISSTTKHIDVTDFFLCPETGNEIPIKLKGADFQVRDGHEVTVVLGNNGSGPSHLIVCANHNTGDMHETPWINAFFKMKRYQKFVLYGALAAWAVGLIFLIVPLVMAITMIIFDGPLAMLVGLPLILVIAYVGYIQILKWFIRKNTVPDDQTIAKLNAIKKRIMDDVVRLLQQEGVQV